MSQGVSKEDLEKALKDRIAAENLVIFDTSGGCGSKFEIYVSSARFEGLGLLERHRLVNEALTQEMTQIHALSLKTWTPVEWEKKKQTIIQPQ